jgi:hypothetical protein
MQNPSQRGFTKGLSPMNAALPVEEAYRILTDEKQNGHLIVLASDVKRCTLSYFASVSSSETMDR